MNSFRSRIAIICVVLLCATIAITSLLQVIVFRHNLFEERSKINDSILQGVAAYITKDGIPSTLDRWGSAITYVHIDEQLPDGNARILEESSEFPQTDHHLLFHEKTVLYKGRTLFVRVESDLEDIDETLARTQLFIVIFSLLIIPVVVIISIALSGGIIRPIEDLIRAVQHIDSEKLDQRVGLEKRTDELGALARAFDAMLDRLQESFERERRFIADASHELKTPLTVIHANAQMLRRWAQSNEVVRSESIEVIIAESKGLGLLVEELLLLARLDSGDLVAKEDVNLLQVCEELVRGIQTRIGVRPIVASLRTDDDAENLTMMGNAILLRRIFSNLLDNALKFTLEGEVVLTLSRVGDMIEVVVSDTGVGIHEEELILVFERLYRSDRARTRQAEGFGLGLSIARAFVQIHRGRIFAQSRRGAGTSVHVQLPASSPAELTT